MSALKKLRGIPHIFCDPLGPIPNLSTCPPRPGAREPIPVTIPFDYLRKKEQWCKRQMLVMSSQRWTIPEKECVTIRSSLKVVVYRLSRSRCGSNVDGKKKVMKKQRKSKEKGSTGKVNLCSNHRSLNIWLGLWILLKSTYSHYNTLKSLLTTFSLSDTQKAELDP
jgi:hypothetical protein